MSDLPGYELGLARYSGELWSPDELRSSGEYTLHITVETHGPVAPVDVHPVIWWGGKF